MEEGDALKPKKTVSKYLLGASLLCVAIVASVLINGALNKLDNAQSNNDGNEFFIGSGADYPVFHTLEDMIHASEYILAGSFGDLLHSYNMSRDSDNVQLESKIHYTEGEIYRFNVQSALKGDLQKDVVNVVLKRSERIDGAIDGDMLLSGMAVRELELSGDNSDSFDRYAFEVVDPRYMKPDIRENVILFLQYDSIFDDELLDAYYPSGEPYVIRVNIDGSVQLKSNLLYSEDRVFPAEPQLFITENGNKIRYMSYVANDIIEDNVSHLSYEDILQKIH